MAWYAFGRQGLDTSLVKTLFSSDGTNTPSLYCTKRRLYFLLSGYCLKYEGDEDRLLTQLNFGPYAGVYQRIESRDFRGGWKAW
ncbi:MAG: hypothetical protein IPN94_10750 [Sphingobacteriales bacterium]|nr:hypothetical protein [Sphingobacteriales bacterium]